MGAISDAVNAGKAGAMVAPGVGIDPVTGALVAGGGTLLASGISSVINKRENDRKAAQAAAENSRQFNIGSGINERSQSLNEFRTKRELAMAEDESKQKLQAGALTLEDAKRKEQWKKDFWFAMNRLNKQGAVR
jgi:hypothetical protein